jgi:hypothetical protein
MTDRELLELAARAAGLEIQQWVESRNTFFLEPYQQHWNPLLDDGDALRLAVRLRIDLMFDSTLVGGTPVEVSCMWPPFEDGCSLSQLKTNDPYAATRRAIVRAAAEIGKEL